MRTFDARLTALEKPRAAPPAPVRIFRQSDDDDDVYHDEDDAQFDRSDIDVLSGAGVVCIVVRHDQVAP